MIIIIRNPTILNILYGRISWVSTWLKESIKAEGIIHLNLPSPAIMETANATTNGSSHIVGVTTEEGTISILVIDTRNVEMMKTAKVILHGLIPNT